MKILAVAFKLLFNYLDALPKLKVGMQEKKVNLTGKEKNSDSSVREPS